MKKGMICTLALCCSVLLTGCGEKKGAAVTYDNVDALLTEAEQKYEEGSFIDSLTLYADAIKTNPLSIGARLGAAKCQSELKNYNMAADNISAAAKIDPTAPEIYDAYLDLAAASESIYYARTAVSLAKTNHMDSFLERVPEAPQLSLEEGSYDSRQELTITAADGAEITVTEWSGNSRSNYQYDGEPIRLLSGETTITAYCVKDGIPSEEISAVYQLEYEPTVISFRDPVIEEAARDQLDNEDGPITDLDCEGVRYLYCDFDYDLRRKLEKDTYTLNTLADLQYFPRLSILSFDETKISADLNELGSLCRYLNELSFYECGIKNIEFVSSIPKLASIEIYDNEELKDISPLADCSNLTRVSLTGTGVTDLSPLYDKTLSRVSLELSDKIDSSVIASWKDSLYYLELYNCGGKDLNWLQEYTGLTDLSLHAYNWSYSYDEDVKPLKDLGFLSSLTNMEYLYLHGLDDPSSLEVVKSLKNLSYLYFTLNDRDAEIPDDLITDLQSSLPNCKISY
ncbi:MAG: hypothetical protein K6G61_05385 [Solobacterium sp.]|nr:hypothetical protein [Solobacterium sp.]